MESEEAQSSVESARKIDDKIIVNYENKKTANTHKRSKSEVDVHEKKMTKKRKAGAQKNDDVLTKSSKRSIKRKEDPDFIYS